MHCEYQQNCGFYIALAEHNKLVNDTCGKDEPVNCHRFRHANEGGSHPHVIKALAGIGITDDPLTSSALANNSEVTIFMR